MGLLAACATAYVAPRASLAARGPRPTRPTRRAAAEEVETSSNEITLGATFEVDQPAARTERNRRPLLCDALQEDDARSTTLQTRSKTVFRLSERGRRRYPLNTDEFVDAYRRWNAAKNVDVTPDDARRDIQAFMARERRRPLVARGERRVAAAATTGPCRRGRAVAAARRRRRESSKAAIAAAAAPRRTKGRRDEGCGPNAIPSQVQEDLMEKWRPILQAEAEEASKMGFVDYVNAFTSFAPGLVTKLHGAFKVQNFGEIRG